MSTHITAEFNYLKPDPRWDVEKPYTLFLDVSNIKGAEPTNIIKEPVKNVKVTDVRNLSEEIEMDKHGFEVVDLGRQFEPRNFTEEEWVHTCYYPQACKLVKEKVGAKEVRAYQHKLRYRHPGFGDIRLRGPDGYDPPIPHVHADVTPAYAQVLFEQFWPEEVQNLPHTRAQVLNLWRPLVDVVKEWPLALCSCASVDTQRDIREADQVKRRKGSTESDNDFEVIESYLSFYHSDHCWYYLSNQSFHEGWLIKLYDSQPGVSSGTLHSSIDTGASDISRRSCELRMLAIFD